MNADGAASAAGPGAGSRLAPLRYAAVGAVATVAHYCLLWGLVEHGHWWPALAAGAGAALGAQVGFVGNRWFTFQHRGPWLTAWWRFQLTALLGGATSVAVVAAGLGLGLHYLVAQAGATLLVLLLTYAINRRWAFG
jgi:putative flippase GtrA